MHTMNNAGVRFENAGVTVENVRIDDVADGIRPVAGPFVIRGTWLSYIRDDCVENDHVQPGLIDDSLFDGCYVGISERPSLAIITSGYDGRNDLLTVRQSLIRQVKHDMRDWTLSKIVWVADRGFSSEHNRRYLRQGDHAYIIGEKLRSDSPQIKAALSRQGRQFRSGTLPGTDGPWRGS